MLGETAALALHAQLTGDRRSVRAAERAAEAGFIGDRRCRDALELLESKRLPDRGFPAEGKYYRVSEGGKTGRSLVDWGGVSRKHMNEFVTVDTLFVLNKSGRLR